MVPSDEASVQVEQPEIDPLNPQKTSVTLTLVKGPDGHDYVVGLSVPVGGMSATKAISVVHAAGCRKCAER